MTMKTKTFVTSFGVQNKKDLYAKRDSLIVQKMKLDKFFTLFLDKFSNKMDPEQVDTPIWKLYKTKLKEYDDIQRELTSTIYFINK